MADEGFRLSKDTMIIMNALSNMKEAVDVLQLMPEDEVDKILANREKISAKLGAIRFNELDMEGRIRTKSAEIDMEVSMMQNFGKK